VKVAWLRKNTEKHRIKCVDMNSTSNSELGGREISVKENDLIRHSQHFARIFQVIFIFVS
jgi:hypothetical protein